MDAPDQSNSTLGGHLDSIDTPGIRIQLEFDLPDSCVLATDGVDRLRSRSRVRGQCQALLSTDASDDLPSSVIRVTKRVTNECICPLFHEHSCPPEFREIDGSTVEIVTWITDRAQIRSLIAELREHSASPKLLQIGDGYRTEEGNWVTFDLSELTQTQRSTLELAVSEGYYDSPKEITLDEIAKQLNISKSAVSRRLSTIEAKIVTSVLRQEP